MSDTKFTPGPWEVVADEISYGDVPCEQIQGEKWVVALALADANELRKRVSANAHLIAAAPELYEALREAKGLADMSVMSDDQDGTPSEDQAILVKLRARIDAALAKARGEQSA